MADPTDEQLMAEAERLREADAKKRLPWWPFFYCVLPIVAALVLIVVVNRPSNNDGRQNTTTGVPDLGHTGRPLVKPDAPTKDGDPPADGAKDGAVDTVKDGKTDGVVEKPPDTPPEPDKPVSDFEIEISIRNIQSGVKNNQPRTIEAAQKWLRDNVSRGPVTERITAALGSEQNARIRLALFEAFADDKAALDWALSVYRSKSAKFMGTEENYAEGEIEELTAYYAKMAVREQGRPLTQNALRTEKPAWLLAQVAAFTVNDTASLALGLDEPQMLQEIYDLLVRLTAPEANRERLFLFWARTTGDLAPRLRSPPMEKYLPLWLTFYLPFNSQDHPELEEILQFVSTQLSSPDANPALKAEIIAALENDNLRNNASVVAMLAAGLARKDANYPDYLALLGRVSRKSSDYDLLRSAANDAKPEVARGAITGLKNAPAGEAADVRLLEILNEGANSSVKADAFAALIERKPAEKDKLVNEYLDPVKPVALRVVAVAHVPAKDVERLQELAVDNQLKVREAAIHRLGALKDKKLLLFLKRVSTHDNSAVLRQLAAKYAAELE